MRPGTPGALRPPTPTPVAAPIPGELHGGGFHSVGDAARTAAAGDLAGALLAAVQRDQPAQLGGFAATDFDEVSRSTTKTLRGDVLEHITLRQHIGGVPVDGSYLRFTRPVGGAAAKAGLMSSSHHLYRHRGLDVTATMSRDQAIAAARARLRAPERAALIGAELVVHPIAGELALVWKVALRGSHFRAFVRANGASAGRVVIEDARVYEVSGAVKADVAEDGAPGANATLVAHRLPNLTVVAEGGAAATTDADGEFTVEAEDGELISARLLGTAAEVFNVTGPSLEVTAAASAQGTGLAFITADGEELAQTTTYQFVDHTRRYLEANGVPSVVLGPPLTCNTNLPDVCNAFYSSFERSINFFQEGGGCHNSAIDSIIVHEYGHFADDANGGIFDSGLSEGWGDLLACYSLDTSIIGEDLTDDNGFVRDCDNEYVFPVSGVDEPHALGQAWAGFAWQVRQGLIEQLGAEDGDAVARALVLPSLVSNAPDIPEAVREVFLRDDDDGDLDNGTVHFDVLIAAAERHGLVNAVFPDELVPAPVTDLEAIEVRATTATLQWTATGDDGLEGTATAYDLRISSEPIDEQNFFFATPVAAPIPTEAGTVQSAVIAVPPSSTVFVAMRVFDDGANGSSLSNVVEIATDDAVVLFAEDVEDGAPDWTATGLWHVTAQRSGAGAQSFWYGQETTRNYDTGAPNAGELISPVISLAGSEGALLRYSEFLEVEPTTFFDVVAVTVTDVDDPSHSVTVFDEEGFSGGVFVTKSVSLTEFDGANIQIAFQFDTIDEVANDLEGWFVDDIVIIADAGTAICAHDLCVEGGALDPACDDCVASVCAADAACCDSAWTQACIDEAVATCGLECSAPVCGDGACSAVGGEDCETCPEDCGICRGCGDGFCEPGEDCGTCPEDCGACPECGDGFCNGDEDCASCSEDCGACPVCGDGECTGDEDCLSCSEDCGECEPCSHDLCEPGEPLESTCDECAQTVCDADPFCCEFAWDEFCVQEAIGFCGLECDQCGNGVCDPDESCLSCADDCGECPACAHEACEVGEPLAFGCDSCAANVCKTDSFCCEVAWDELCVGLAEEHCAISCDLDTPPAGKR
ncbi:hypothetical protein [Haliangium sp.]|uniref:hypothetical protein n=1 Tax=Haliangium sp. TaxID=2663208 RepID=UPI003D0DD313